MDSTITHVLFALEIKLLLEELMFVLLALLAVLLAFHRILQQMLHVTLVSMATVITTKLKHAISVQQARLLLVVSPNVFYALMAAQTVHQKIIPHQTLPVLLVSPIMDLQMAAAHCALETKLHKVDKLFVLIAQVDVTSVMALFAHLARVTFSYLTIPAKLVLIVPSPWEEIPLDVLHAAVIALLVMLPAALHAKMVPL